VHECMCVCVCVCAYYYISVLMRMHEPMFGESYVCGVCVACMCIYREAERQKFPCMIVFVC
jgi:hypothetical protein